MYRHIFRLLRVGTVFFIIILGPLLMSGQLAAVFLPSAQAESCPEVQNTPSFTLVFGTITWNGQPAAAGTVVEARTPTARGGVTTGCFIITSQGDYGTMFVYGEDLSVSPPIPGMRAGETLEFFVNNKAAVASPAQTWSNDREIHKVHLTALGATPPVAAFTAKPTFGTAPLVVQFTDQSTGDITSRLWNFGDGATSTQTSPSHTYSAVGVYTVTLTAAGPSGSDGETKTGYITIKAVSTISAQFSATPTRGLVPLGVKFTDQSSGYINSWLWEFGDGTASSLQHPSHLYPQTGVYTVTLTVSGVAGSHQRLKSKYITVNSPVETTDFIYLPLVLK